MFLCPEVLIEHLGCVHDQAPAAETRRVRVYMCCTWLEDKPNLGNKVRDPATTLQAQAFQPFADRLGLFFNPGRWHTSELLDCREKDDLQSGAAYG
jgi:hypothetical protein